MEWILDSQIWIGLLTLTALEIVLGIDNIVFISIVAGRLPDKSQKKARLLGLALAMIMRVLLLLTLSWIMRLTEPLFAVGNFWGLRPGIDPDCGRPFPTGQEHTRNSPPN